MSGEPLRRLRARRRGSKVWYYYDAGGKPRREIPLGCDYYKALQRWADLEGTQHVPAVVTLPFVAEQYRIKILPGKAPRTQRDNEKELKWLLRFFGDPPAPLDQVTPHRVKQYMRWRVDVQEGRGAVRAVREKALLSHIWNFAREEGYTALPNPCAGIRGAKGTSTGRDIYVEDEIKAAIWAAADVATQDAIDLAYLGGQRPADTLKLSEAHVREGVLHVRGNKTKAKVRIAVEGELKVVLDRIQARKSAYQIYDLALVVNEKGQPLTHRALQDRFSKARARAAKDPKNAGIKAEILAAQFRDFRAKAATDDAEREDLREAQKKLGHTSIRMTEHYVRNRRGAKVKPTR